MIQVFRTVKLNSTWKIGQFSFFKRRYTLSDKRGITTNVFCNFCPGSTILTHILADQTTVPNEHTRLEDG